MYDLKFINKKTCTLALGLSKIIFSFDFVICLSFMKNVMYKTKIFTENLEASELNIIYTLMLLTYTMDSFTKMSDNNMALHNLIKSAIIFAKKLNINPEKDFDRHHRKRLKPKNIYSNASTLCTINIKAFYRMKFKKVFETLVNLSSEKKIV